MASSAFPPEPLAVIAQEVSDLLKEKGESVAVAETVCLPYAYRIPKPPIEKQTRSRSKPDPPAVYIPIDQALTTPLSDLGSRRVDFCFSLSYPRSVQDIQGRRYGKLKLIHFSFVVTRKLV